MNKELYIKKQNAIKRERQIFCHITNLKEFLKDNEKNFKEVESIKALQTIRNYLIKKEKELKEAEQNSKYISKEFASTCKHEITIKQNPFSGYCCLICNRRLTSDNNSLPNNTLICIDAVEDYHAFLDIQNSFKEISHTDKDLIETMSELVEDMQYDSNIKVYRR